MASGLALAGAAARARVRSRGAIVAGTLCAAALALAVALPAGSGSGAASAAVESALFVCAVLVALAAASSGGDLPAARDSGAGDWLATLAPPAAARRLAPAVAGVALSLAVGLGGAGVSAILLAASGHGVPTAEALPLAVPADARVGADSGRLLPVLFVPPRAEPTVLEVDFRPVYHDLAALSRPSVPVQIAVAPAFTEINAEVAPRGTHRIPLEASAGIRDVYLRGADQGVTLFIVAARLRGSPRPFLANVLLAGLLLGLAAACAVPLAVLLSRAVSGPTAAAGAAVLMLLGVVHGPLLELAADAAAAPGGALAGTILRGAAAAAPDLSGVLRVEDVALGRFLGLDAFAGLLPAAAYAGICLLLLALLPGRQGAQ